jgi:hypothetical protein
LARLSKLLGWASLVWLGLTGGPAVLGILLAGSARFRVIEPLLPALARVAGEAIAAVKGATVVDAVVMASAASRGDRVLTSDFDDLDRLRSYFPEARLLQT